VTPYGPSCLEGHCNYIFTYKNVTDACVLCTQLTMNDFSVHRIIGRGGFGEVYGCRKADTGKM